MLFGFSVSRFPTKTVSCFFLFQSSQTEHMILHFEYSGIDEQEINPFWFKSQQPGHLQLKWIFWQQKLNSKLFLIASKPIWSSSCIEYSRKGKFKNKDVIHIQSYFWFSLLVKQITAQRWKTVFIPRLSL